MTYTIRWHDPEQTILYVVYPKGWTWDDFHKIEMTVQDILNQEREGGRVDVIADMQQGIIPKGSVIPHAASIDKGLHPRVGIATIVQQNPIARAVSQSALRTVPNRGVYKLVESVAKAEEVIRQSRAEA